MARSVCGVSAAVDTAAADDEYVYSWIETDSVPPVDGGYLREAVAEELSYSTGETRYDVASLLTRLRNVGTSLDHDKKFYNVRLFNANNTIHVSYSKLNPGETIFALYPVEVLDYDYLSLN